MLEEFSSHDVAVYGGYLANEAEILKSSSGGIAAALSEFMLMQGGYVAGVVYSEDFYKAEYTIIHDISELSKLRGSKYIDCDKKDIYSDVKELLVSGEKVLFFGLPCVVAALYAFLGERPSNLLTCELVCHGPTSPQVHRDYISFLEKKYSSKVIDFSVRHKLDSWLPLYVYARFENGKVFKKPFYETEYGFAFSALAKAPCYDCSFKGNNRKADIMLGDFWGAKEEDEYWNKYGVSSVFAETDKGNQFLNSAPGIVLFPVSFEKAVEHNPMVIKSRAVSIYREKFSELLSVKGLIYAVNHSVSFKIRLKKTVKKLIPSAFKPKLKRVYRSIKSGFDS